MGNLLEILIQLSLAYQVTFALFLLVFVTDLVALCSIHLRVGIQRIRCQKAAGKHPKVSVILCVRDHIDELERNIELFLTQEYPDYEVIIVDDSADDDTAFRLERLRQANSRLHITTAPPDGDFIPNRKLSLAIGIKAAQSDWILTTEATCRPYGKQWISALAQHFTSEYDIVIGYGGLRRAHTAASAYYCAEARWKAISRLGFALAGGPFIGQRRNLAFRKQLFFDNRGYAGYNHLAGGDDDLFTLEVAKKRRTCVEIAPQAQTLGIPPTTWAQIKRIHQAEKETWAYYPDSTKRKLRAEPNARLLLWLLAIPLLTGPWQVIVITLSAILLRRILHGLILLLAARRLKGGTTPLFAWLYDLAAPWIALKPTRQRRKGKIQRAWR